MKQYKKLPTNIQLLAEEKEVIFRIDPHDPRLRTHKLSGRLLGKYAFSVNNSYRVMFAFENKNLAKFYEIGNHDIYE
jgi:plasmid maintenance system killer protein